MAALSAPRNTPQRTGDVLSFLMAAATTIYQGALVVVDAGYAVPGSTKTGLVAAGRAEQTVTSVALGDSRVPVKTGTFQFANAAADLVTQADVGTDCYIVDDQTVAKTSGGSTRSRAGKVVAIDATGVWVKIGLGD